MGFHAPASLLAKMRCFMSCVRTDPAATDDELLRRSKGQIAAWETERRRFSGLASLPGALLLQTVGRTNLQFDFHPFCKPFPGPAAKMASATPQRSSVQSLSEERWNGVERMMAEVKTETPAAAVTTG